MKSDYLLRINYQDGTRVELPFKKLSLYQIEKVFYSLAFALATQEFYSLEFFLVVGSSMRLMNKAFKHGVIER